MNDEQFAEGFADAAYFTEHHVPDLNHVGKFMLSKLAHDQGYKTILTGEGSDEHFGGYTMFYADMLREKDLQWPGAELDEATRPQLVYMIEEMGRAPLRKLPVKRLNVIGDDGLKGGSGADGDVRATWRRNLNNVALPSYLLPQTCIDFSSWTECYGDWDPRETTVRATGVSTLEKINKKWHPLNTSAHIFIRSGLANALLTGLGDRTEMAHSVEGRPAFLDHVLAEYANGLPPSMKLRFDPATRTFNEKWILKEAMKPYLTEELYKRKKHVSSHIPYYPFALLFSENEIYILTISIIALLGTPRCCGWRRSQQSARRLGDAGECRATRLLGLECCGGGEEAGSGGE